MLDSVLFKLGPLTIKYYSVFIFLGILTACILIFKEANKKNIDKDFLENLIFYEIIIGILGARIYYVLFNLDYYLNNIGEIFMIWNGGLAIHGGLLAGLAFLIYYCNKNKVNSLLITDISVVGIIIAQSIGRWGNFFNEEAFGRIVNLSYLENLHLPKFIVNGMYIDGFYREPTFLYESVLNAIGFILLLIIRKKSNIKIGGLTSLYLIWYGIVRLIIETLRSDSLMLGPLKIAQVISIIFIIAGIILLIKTRSNNKYKEEICIRK